MPPKISFEDIINRYYPKYKYYWAPSSENSKEISNISTAKEVSENFERSQYSKGYANGYSMARAHAKVRFGAAITVDHIIFNPPATIVFWKDGTKTVVKCSKGEKFNKYYGFCAALAKKIYATNSKVNRIVNNGIEEGKPEKKVKTSKKDSDKTKKESKKK